MEMKEILALTPTQLQEKWVQLSQQFLNLRMKKQLGQLKVPSEYRLCRKDRARVLMALNKKHS